MEKKGKSSPQSPLLTYRQVAKILGIGEQTARRWVSQGKLPYIKLGSCVRFRLSDLGQFVEDHSVPMGGSSGS